MIGALMLALASSCLQQSFGTDNGTMLTVSLVVDFMSHWFKGHNESYIMSHCILPM